MFTHKEYREGVKEYRKQISRQKDPYHDEHYEYSRFNTESSLLNDLVTHDNDKLVQLYTFLVTLMKESFSSYSFASHALLALMVTYYRIIAEKIGQPLSEFDKSYYHGRFAEGLISTGGFVGIMAPIIGGKLYISFKTPIIKTEGRNRLIVHEAFVGIVCLNPLRQLIRNFSYVYGLWGCGDPSKFDLCPYPGGRYVMLYESVPDSRTLYHRLSSGGFSTLNILGYLVQIFAALQHAHDFCDYTHNDLHSGNILVSNIHKSELSYFNNKISVNTTELIVIIDNGLVHCRLPDRTINPRIKDFGSIYNAEIGVFRNRSYPLGDIFRIFFDIYSLCPPEIKNDLKVLVQYFFTEEFVPKKIYGHVSSVVEDNLVLPPLNPQMMSVKYSDFLNLILKQFADFPGFREHVKYPKRWKIPQNYLKLFKIRLDNNVQPNLNVYQLGVCRALNPESAAELVQFTTDRAEHRTRKFMTIKNPVDLGKDLVRVIGREITLETLITETEFGHSYFSFLGKINRLVDHINVMYDEIIMRFRAFLTMGFSREESMEKLLSCYGKTSEELSRHLTFVATYENPLTEDEIQSFWDVTEKCNAVAGKIKGHEFRYSQEALRKINNFRVYTPGVFVYLGFMRTWLKLQAGEDGSFGKLALPDLESVE